MSENNFPNLPKMPELRVSKNGYEIRSDVLAMAKDIVMQDYQVRMHGWEITALKDERTGQLTTTVAMPEFPGLEKILEAAEKMYSFVNQSKK
jgi:hypothetical protein